MNNKTFLNNDVESNVSEEEITLAPPTELFDEAKEIAKTTVDDDKFPFMLHYDANQKEHLLSMLGMVGAIVEDDDDDGHVLATMMNMTQLAFIKRLDCVERVKTDEGEVRNPFLMEEAAQPAAIMAAVASAAPMEMGTMQTEPIMTPAANDGIAVASASAGARSSCGSSSSCGCPTNTSMATAREINVESIVSGNICCPRAEQWFKFVATKDGQHTIYTIGSLDTIGTLYDGNGNLLAYVNNYEPCGKLNFRIIHKLTEGMTYYVKVQVAGENTGSYHLKVTDTVLAESVTVTPSTFTLQKGVWYELPLSQNYTYRAFDPNNNPVHRIPGLSVSIPPSNATNQDVWWYEEYGSILQCRYGWDNDFNGNRYIHVKADNVGTAKLYAVDWNDHGAVYECTVFVRSEPETVSGLYNIENVETGKVVNISGSYLVNLSNGKNITLYSKSGSNEQVWEINTISDSEVCYIRSYIDQNYGFNAYCSPSGNYNCNIHEISGNEADAAVHFVLQDDGSYKIKLSNYSNYYLTADGSDDGSDIRWQPEDSEKKQHWKLVDFDIEQREAEKTEYHIIPYSDINLETKRALQVDMNTPNDHGLVKKTYRLANDEPLELATFSYVNKQKWLIKDTGTTCQICTAHGDNYHLCKKSDTVAYVSDDDSYESFITVEKYDTSQNLVRIKLTSSNLYLTVSDAGIIWSSLNNNSATQLWQVISKPNNIHNGADTSTVLYDKTATDKDRTVRACKLGGEKFIIRYYAKEENDDKVLTQKEVEAFNNYGINIVSVYQDVGDEDKYFSQSLGTQNAIRALQLARELEQPKDTAIYFAVDYDARSQTELDNICAYFAAIKAVFAEQGNQYRIGVYGSGAVCKIIRENYAQYSWLNCATGHWEYNQYDSTSKYNIKQAEEIRYNGKTFDDCVAVGDDYGQWYK